MPPKPILIAQISDLHIKAPGELAYGKVDTAAALTRCVAALNALAPRPDLVVISGDLVDTPTEQEYAHLMRLLAPLEIPFVAVPGNHDSRELMRTAFPQPAFPGEGPLNQLHPVAGLDVVLLDSSVPGQPHGELDADTLQWLEAVLSASDQRPALLFLHHPPFRTGIWHMDRQNLRNSAEFALLVERYPWVRLVASGHVHRATATAFAGTVATICPAPNHAVALDLGELLEPSFRVEPPAFHLHAWFEGGAFGEVVTHLVPVGSFDGPHPFFGPDGRLL
ncbi:phosphodiesterase [Rhodopseudomonas sp. WA056]|uniref:Metallophosphoesterase n=1 Tax=Rhodopseudomonas palustris (strain DX-1) TaxID=652103 RepID=E6VJP6_RHOPX|nr:MULTISPECIES: phosphodiesterase [Rhodopseudomonas]NEW87613.1 phosphodiesterase [Rhodopseudomonas sp. WA056]QDL96389.1 phosphodiesterase [Rhodopseudomonas palustris]